MKAITILIVSILWSVCGWAQQNQYKVFPFKTAIVEYEQSGNTQGRRTQYIDEYGYKQAGYSQTTTTMMGFTTTENTAQIMVGSTVYAIDYSENSVTESQSPLYALYANSTSTDYEKLGRQALSGLGYHNTGEKESICGKSCEIWKGSLGSVYIWKGLTLKSVTQMLGIKVEEIAVSVKTDCSVPSDKFIVPENMQVNTVDNQQGLEGLNAMFGNEAMEENMEMGMSEEDKANIRKLKKMSYNEFRKMMLEEDPEITDEEIKQAHAVLQYIPVD